jgi:hypothetical protein
MTNHTLFLHPELWSRVCVYQVEEVSDQMIRVI